MDFSQIILPKAAIALLKRLSENPITFSRGDIRIAQAEILRRYELIDFGGDGSVPTKINDVGRNYLTWHKRNVRNKILNTLSWWIVFVISVLTLIYSFLNYKDAHQAYNSQYFQDYNGIIQDDVGVDVIVNPVSPSSESSQ